MKVTQRYDDLKYFSQKVLLNKILNSKHDLMDEFSKGV